MRKTGAWAFGFILLTIVALVLLGRDWWCDTGTWIPWTFDISSESQSQLLLDWYTFTHILHGVVFFYFFAWAFPKWSNDRKMLWTLGLESFWEFIETTPFIIDRYRAINISLGYYGDSIANSMSDIVACMLGYYICKWTNWKWGLVLFILIEAVMLLSIRDSLTLNVIMLIHPFEFLQDWQQGK